MDREDIIRMARSDDWAADVSLKWDAFFVRFANLVAAAEREKVAAWMIQRGYATGHGDTTEDLLNELNWQIAGRIAAEREACAKVCDVVIPGDEYSTALINSYADDIRARGEK